MQVGLRRLFTKNGTMRVETGGDDSGSWGFGAGIVHFGGGTPDFRVEARKPDPWLTGGRAAVRGSRTGFAKGNIPS